MPKRGKSERRDPEQAEEDPKTPTKTPTKRKSNVLRSSKKPKDVVSVRWEKKKNSKKWNFGKKKRIDSTSKSTENKSSETEQSRYVTPQKKKRIDSTSNSTQNKSSGTDSPPYKRVKSIRMMNFNDYKKTIVKEGGVKLILDDMKRRQFNAIVQINGCRVFALGNDDEEHGEKRKTIATEGGIKVIFDAMKQHKSNAGVQQHGCEALWCLA